MTIERTPEAISESTIRVCGIEVKLFILDDGRRVIDKDSMDKVFALMGTGKFPPAEAARLARWAKGKSLQ